MAEKKETKTLVQALIAAQSEMQGAIKNKKNPRFGSSYADLQSVFEAVREPLLKHGILVTQTIHCLESGFMKLVTTLWHEGGEKLESEMLLPNIPDPQKLGSAITYFRRFSLMAITGIAPEDDDDANAAVSASQVKTISDMQFQALVKTVNGRKDIVEKLAKRYPKGLNTIPLESYDRVFGWVKSELSKEV